MSDFEDRIDRLVNLDFGQRGVEALYEAARARAGRPLAAAAAECLTALKQCSLVLLTTGSPTRPWVSPAIGENDGPPGTALLARALALGLEAVPVLVAEAALLHSCGLLLQAAGLSLVSLDEARHAGDARNRLSVAVLRDYPLEDRAGEAAAGPLLEELKPAACFAIERGGRNSKGIYHSSRGADFGEGRARVDFVFDEARRRGIPTLGVGDGGNEIGMGAVAEAVRRFVRHGDRCACGCGGGIGAVTEVDVLVTAAVSNWGCAAVVACLAARLRRPDLLPSAELERRLLLRGVDAGLINAARGHVDPDVDGIPLAVHLAVAEILGELGRRTMLP